MDNLESLTNDIRDIQEVLIKKNSRILEGMRGLGIHDPIMMDSIILSNTICRNLLKEFSRGEADLLVQMHESFTKYMSFLSQRHVKLYGLQESEDGGE